MLKVNLQGPCPIKMDMKFNDDGKFHCGHCNKHVIDFTNHSSQEIKQILNDGKFDSCGSYASVYNEGWLGKTQQKITKQKDFLLSTKAPKWRMILIPMIMVLFLITGCRSRRINGPVGRVRDLSSDRNWRELPAENLNLK